MHRAATPGSRAAATAGADHDQRSWLALEVLRRVTTDEVRALVTVWPGSASIEVRNAAGRRGAIAQAG